VGVLAAQGEGGWSISYYQASARRD
jgi:hypothetical protein